MSSTEHDFLALKLEQLEQQQQVIAKFMVILKISSSLGINTVTSVDGTGTLNKEDETHS
ncbi:MAG: hypothetical protein JOZ78_08130 [Chroococcidiopsidaceae cyanobacterium CP_BM_ER_R8_30]|nr:hypothetical protein [Chroococcidiopsidaceae cyanobacterium CP_BM_ER_R8_30]